MMQNLETMFMNAFGKPLGQVISLQAGLVPIGGSAASAVMFGSPVAAEEPFLIQIDIDRFLTSCPQGYFLVGFGGHGIASSGFYYSRVDAWSRVLYRLPFGGVYTDNDLMAGHILKFLTGFFAYQGTLLEANAHLVATDSMHRGYYQITLSDGRQFESRKSLLGSAAFAGTFGAFLKGNADRSGPAEAMNNANRNYLNKHKARAEEIYAEMYEARRPTAAGAYFREVKELLVQAIALAEELGLADEVIEIRGRLRQIRGVYESQMQ